jgi:hypothetical protein
MKDKVTPYDILDERLKSMDEAKKLQAKEYERRLESLNGEAGRIRDILKESIPREVFDREINSIRTRLAATEAALIKAEGRHQLTQYIPYIIAIAAIAFDYFKK